MLPASCGVAPSPCRPTDFTTQYTSYTFRPGRGESNWFSARLCNCEYSLRLWHIRLLSEQVAPMDSNHILPDTSLRSSDWLTQHVERSLHSQRRLSYISACLQAPICRRDVDWTAVVGMDKQRQQRNGIASWRYFYNQRRSVNKPKLITCSGVRHS